jgi:hypothetical protein
MTRENQRKAAALLLKPILFVGFVTIMAAQSYTVFDVPGATKTYPVAINNSGEIAGYYNNPYNGGGFVREPDGTITVFEGIPAGMNDAGTIVGNYLDNIHCFVRDKKGNVTAFDVPQIDTWRIPYVSAINNRNEVAGYKPICILCDGTRGFIRDQNGNITVFEGGPAVPTAINAGGDVVGHTTSYAFPWHGVLRDRNGVVTVFDVREADNTAGIRAFPIAINNNSEIAGFYQDPAYHSTRGFVREPDGSTTVFDGVPHALNERGDVAGYIIDSTGTARNFLQDKQGNLTIFDVPNAFSPQIASMNASDDIAGYFYETLPDGSLAVHGFVRSAH